MELHGRDVLGALKDIDFADACLLCGEKSAAHCHRRVAVAYLKDKLGLDEIINL